MVHRLDMLSPEDWQRPTVCQEWDVRALASHVLGMAAKRKSGKMIDAMTATQVRERSSMTPDDITAGLSAVAPRAVRARTRTPAPVRWAVRMKQDPPFDAERWKFGYLVDTVFTRDTWLHRLDISRAIGQPTDVTADHDGRLIADVVGEWARRHGQLFTLALEGPAGGNWRAGTDGESIAMDALDFCWVVGSRAPGTGLLATEVPF
jgi:uncharacterized protein (TIGR03083 family)